MNQHRTPDPQPRLGFVHEGDNVSLVNTGDAVASTTHWWTDRRGELDNPSIIDAAPEVLGEIYPGTRVRVAFCSESMGSAEQVFIWARWLRPDGTVDKTSLRLSSDR